MAYKSNYLAHYGIAGQKWGVRRFQNTDGTLTEEGKKRYGKYDNATDYMKNAKEKTTVYMNEVFDVQDKIAVTLDKNNEYNKAKTKMYEAYNKVLKSYNPKTKSYDDKLKKAFLEQSNFLDEIRNKVIYECVSDNYPKDKVETLCAILYADLK